MLTHSFLRHDLGHTTGNDYWREHKQDFKKMSTEEVRPSQPQNHPHLTPSPLHSGYVAQKRGPCRGWRNRACCWLKEDTRCSLSVYESGVKHEPHYFVETNCLNSSKQLILSIGFLGTRECIPGKSITQQLSWLCSQYIRWLPIPCGQCYGGQGHGKETCPRTTRSPQKWVIGRGQVLLTLLTWASPFQYDIHLQEMRRDQRMTIDISRLTLTLLYSIIDFKIWPTTLTYVVTWNRNSNCW